MTHVCATRPLAISNRDYSEWDDGYDYVLERDDTIEQAFVGTLLTGEAMRRSSRPLNTRRGYATWDVSTARLS